MNNANSIIYYGLQLTILLRPILYETLEDGFEKLVGHKEFCFFDMTSYSICKIEI